jgi:hypothetical protein
MGAEPAFYLGAIVVGIGATLVTDGWALLLKRVFGIPSLSYCLVGRWLLHMPGGTFIHSKIATAQPKPFECAAGWITHYVTGIVFALVLVAFVSEGWLAAPTLMPALLFGAGTVLFPFLLMQPALGSGVAASKAPSPTRARLKSFVTHLVFGIGLYVSAVGVGYVFCPAQAELDSSTLQEHSPPQKASGVEAEIRHQKMAAKITMPPR